MFASTDAISLKIFTIVCTYIENVILIRVNHMNPVLFLSLEVFFKPFQFPLESYYVINKKNK